jgi:DNA-binding NarL/FixJ family response regulator
MIAVAAFPAPSLDQISACITSPIAAAIGVIYAANNVIDSKIAVPCIQLGGCCRRQEPSTSRATATEVLRRVAAGKSNKLIAAELDIAEGTVKTHMKSILPKLDASDRTHAVMIALKRGILDI